VGVHMLRRFLFAAFAAVLSAVPALADQASEILLNQYSIYRASPAARYFTPGSLIMGWPYKGVLRLEMVCRNKVDVDKDADILKASLEQGGFSGTSGWQFSIGVTAVDQLNAALGGNFVTNVTMKVENPIVYEYSAEDLRAIRAKLLARPDCAKEVRNSRYRVRDYNGGTAGLFQNQRFALGTICYEIDFNKDNPKALSADVQATVTKKFQAKFGLTYLKASQTKLSGDNVLIGVYPIWRNLWN
jgi:hypothetical protein